MATISSSYYNSFLNSAYGITGNNSSNNPGGLETLGQAIGTWDTPSDSDPPNNLPFDRRWVRRGGGKAGSGAFTSGVVVTAGSIIAQGIADSKGNVRDFTTYFQFNPTEIDLNYTFDSSVLGALNPTYIDTSDPSGGVGTSGSQGIMLNQSISFTLLFDRTYEVWTGPDSTSNDYALNQGPYIFGAQWDMWSLERLVGIYGQTSGKGPSGPPASSLCTVQFGHQTIGLQNVVGGGIGGTTETGSGIQGKSVGGRALGFQGWMTSMQAEYTRFDAAMVPTRLAVALSFEQVYSQQSIFTNNPIGPDGNPGTPKPLTPAQKTAQKRLEIATIHSDGKNFTP